MSRSDLAKQLIEGYPRVPAYMKTAMLDATLTDLKVTGSAKVQAIKEGAGLAASLGILGGLATVAAPVFLGLVVAGAVAGLGAAVGGGFGKEKRTQKDMILKRLTETLARLDGLSTEAEQRAAMIEAFPSTERVLAPMSTSGGGSSRFAMRDILPQLTPEFQRRIEEERQQMLAETEPTTRPERTRVAFAPVQPRTGEELVNGINQQRQSDAAAQAAENEDAHRRFTESFLLRKK